MGMLLQCVRNVRNFIRGVAGFSSKHIRVEWFLIFLAICENGHIAVDYLYF